LTIIRKDIDNPSPPKKNRKPRYLELADELRSAIMMGEFSKEEQFPTETVLCKKFGVSRFTVREALRKLTQEGLISRRRGSGTTIQPASARAGALRQPLSNVGEILQYARDTSINFEKMEPQEIPPKIADQIGLATADKWFVFHGQRMKPGRKRPIAITVAWIHPDLAGAVEKIDVTEATIFGQLQNFAEIEITQITQDIQAITASKHFASSLGIEKGEPILRILRCYFDQNGRLFEISANYHPGERFAYSMHIDVGA
jgi:GntR family transcriptional regulator